MRPDSGVRPRPGNDEREPQKGAQRAGALAERRTERRVPPPSSQSTSARAGSAPAPPSSSARERERPGPVLPQGPSACRVGPCGVGRGAGRPLGSGPAPSRPPSPLSLGPSVCCQGAANRESRKRPREAARADEGGMGRSGTAAPHPAARADRCRRKVEGLRSSPVQEPDGPSAPAGKAHAKEGGETPEYGCAVAWPPGGPCVAGDAPQHVAPALLMRDVPASTAASAVGSTTARRLAASLARCRLLRVCLTSCESR